MQSVRQLGVSLGSASLEQVRSYLCFQVVLSLARFLDVQFEEELVKGNLFYYS